MIKRPKPMNVSMETLKDLNVQARAQSPSRTIPKSTDPKNFPVFEIPTGKKVLIYVPNHVVDGPEGPELRMDKPFIHPIIDGNRYLSYRCIKDIVNDEMGYDGICPLCEGTAVPWEYANAVIENQCRKIGLDPEDKENSQVKTIRANAFTDRVLKEPMRYYTFPIVVFATKNDDCKTIEVEDGKPKCYVMWYHISESQYTAKWVTTLEGMEDEPSHPGGHFFILNYTYDTKGKEPNKRDSARNLTVIAKNLKNTEKLKEYLDNVTEEWTPEKAAETVISNNYYSVEDLQQITDEVLESPRNMLEMIKSSGASVAATAELSVPNASGAIEDKAATVAVSDTDEDDEISGLDFGE